METFHFGFKYPLFLCPSFVQDGRKSLVGISRCTSKICTSDSISAITGETVCTVQRERIINPSNMKQCSYCYCRFDQEMCVGAKLGRISIHNYSLQHSCAL